MDLQNKKNNLTEIPACCCVDVGTIIDNDESITTIEHMLPTKTDAETLLADLTQRAEKVQSKPCKIESYIDEVDGGAKLTATFKFCCGAESLIFQLNLR